MSAQPVTALRKELSALVATFLEVAGAEVQLEAKVRDAALAVSRCAAALPPNDEASEAVALSRNVLQFAENLESDFSSASEFVAKATRQSMEELLAGSSLVFLLDPAAVRLLHDCGWRWWAPYDGTPRPSRCAAPAAAGDASALRAGVDA